MRRPAWLVLLLIGLAAPASPAAAQGVGIAAGVGLYGLGGSDYSNVSRSSGLDGRVFYQSAGGLQLGAGYFATTLALRDSGDVSRTTFFVEPRWAFLVGESRVVPYIGLRGSYVREDRPGDFDANGFGGGGVVGFYLRMGETSALDISGTATRFQLDRISGADAPPALDRLSGTIYGVRLGVVFALATF